MLFEFQWVFVAIRLATTLAAVIAQAIWHDGLVTLTVAFIALVGIYFVVRAVDGWLMNSLPLKIIESLLKPKEGQPPREDEGPTTSGQFNNYHWYPHTSHCHSHGSTQQPKAAIQGSSTGPKAGIPYIVALER
jgi:hypothetical protein